MNNIIYKRRQSSNIFNGSKSVNILESFYKVQDNNVLYKTFFSKTMFDYELCVISILNKMQLKIIPDMLDVTEFNITYDMNNIVSLRYILKKNKGCNVNFHHLVNELSSFLKTIQYSKLLIPNLNIDTIYVNNKTLEFYIIDFSQSIFTDKILNLELDFKTLYISVHKSNITQKNKDYFYNELQLIK